MQSRPLFPLRADASDSLRICKADLCGWTVA